MDACADAAPRACARSSTWTRSSGYFPPVANPPSKGPLLTLLKQGRAFGIGVLLATQNPVDLDYKGLANTGTWFLGRLQTERDKARMLDGLEGAAAGTLDRATADRLLSALDKRVFLLHDVHASGPDRVPEPLDAVVSAGADVARSDSQAADAAIATGRGAAAAATAAAGAAQRPSAAPARRCELPRSRSCRPASSSSSFPPAAAAGPSRLRTGRPGSARVGFSDTKNGIDESRDVLYAAEISDGAVPVDWTAASRLDVPASPGSSALRPDRRRSIRCRPPPCSRRTTPTGRRRSAAGCVSPRRSSFSATGTRS